jgi:DNA polymerase III alpha subunit
MPDIDIDFVDRAQALKLFRHVVASRLDNDKLVKHNTGVYLHTAPVNAESGICAIPYDSAEELGYFKIDFLNVGIYKGVRDEDHLTALLNQEPLWDLLEQQEFVDMLFHVNGHHELLKNLKPTSIEQLAAVLAMIRPAKKHLVGRSWKEILQEVWIKPNNNDYYFKKSHATAYAIAVVVQMNLICEQISYGYQ